MTTIFEGAGDASGWIDTSYSLSVGDVFIGEIASSSDTDTVAISLTEGQRIRISLDGETLADPYLSVRYEQMFLYGSSLVTIEYDNNSGPGLNSRISFRVPETATYYITAGGNSTNTGSYQLTVTEVVPLTLTDFSDNWVGDDAGSIVRGLAGNDIMSGLGGRDRLNGGAGNDSILGGEGHDRLYGAIGDDTLIGGEGDDRLYDGAGNDLVRGGAGDDNILSVHGGRVPDEFSDTIHGGSGNDSIAVYNSEGFLHGGLGDDTIRADSGYRIFGGDGDDSIRVSEFSRYTSLAATVHGGDGIDRLQLVASGPSRYVISLDDSIESTDGIRVSGVEHLSLIDIYEDTHWPPGRSPYEPVHGYLIGNDVSNEISGGRYGDTIRGGAGADILNGGLGNDVLRGGVGRDVILGSRGHDILYGGVMNDTLRGGFGSDTLNGGSGLDVADYSNSTSGIYLALSPGFHNSGGATGDVLVDIEGVIGSEHADVIFGSQTGNLLIGNSGDDHLDGLRGHDTLSGGTGHDVLLGGDGRDSISGGDGRDVLEGGLGRDTLSGGAGADEFRFLRGDGRDVIEDFNLAHDTFAVSDFYLNQGLTWEDTLYRFARETNAGLLIEFSDSEAVLFEGLDLSDVPALADRVDGVPIESWL